MSNRHHLTILLCDGLPTLSVDVLEAERQRLIARLWIARATQHSVAPFGLLTAPLRRSRKPAKRTAAPPPQDAVPFIDLKTVDGRYVMLNLLSVQGVFSSTSTSGPPEPEAGYEGPTQILLRDQQSALDVFPPDDATIGDMVMALEHGPDVVPWIRLNAADGDLLFNARAVVYVIAATSRLLAAYEGFIKDSEG